MSELTYKKITDVEQVEALNDGATVLVNDNGALKQVAAGAIGGGSGGGGMDIHILTIRNENDESTYESNMTYDELRQKILGGVPLVGFIQSWSINQSPGLDSSYINVRCGIEDLNYGMSTEEGSNIRITDYNYGDYYDIKPDGTIEYGQQD